VLSLAGSYEFARPLVNSGRLSVPCTYDGSPLNGPDDLGGPERTRPGSPCPDAELADGFLLSQLGNDFVLLCINADGPDSLEESGISTRTLILTEADDPKGYVKERYLGDAKSAVYLIRPDQHVAARHAAFDEKTIRADIRRAIGKE